MKKLIVILVVLIGFGVSSNLMSCKSKEQKEAEKALKEVSNMAQEILELQKRLNKDEITKEEFEKLSREIREKYGEEIEELAEKEKIEKFKGLPDWAKELGLSEPKGMKLVEHEITSVDGPTGINSISLTYEGDYDVAMSEAERIAGEANVPLSPEFEMAKKMAEEFGEEKDQIHGITYLDMGPMAGGKSDYMINITVDEEGQLIIAASNQKQTMEKVSKVVGSDEMKQATEAAKKMMEEAE